MAIAAKLGVTAEEVAGDAFADVELSGADAREIDQLDPNTSTEEQLEKDRMQVTFRLNFDRTCKKVLAGVAVLHLCIR